MTTLQRVTLHPNYATKIYRNNLRLLPDNTQPPPPAAPQPHHLPLWLTPAVFIIGMWRGAPEPALHSAPVVCNVTALSLNKTTDGESFLRGVLQYLERCEVQP